MCRERAHRLQAPQPGPHLRSFSHGSPFAPDYLLKHQGFTGGGAIGDSSRITGKPEVNSGLPTNHPESCIFRRHQADIGVRRAANLVRTLVKWATSEQRIRSRPASGGRPDRWADQFHCFLRNASRAKRSPIWLDWLPPVVKVPSAVGGRPASEHIHLTSFCSVTAASGPRSKESMDWFMELITSSAASASRRGGV